MLLTKIAYCLKTEFIQFNLQDLRAHEVQGILLGTKIFFFSYWIYKLIEWYSLGYKLIE